MKSIALFFITLGVVAGVATVEAVVPPPDGGYPGGNTAEGQNALLNLTSGGFNTAVGWLSMRNNTTANFSTAVGAGTLFRNNADENTAVGTGALLSNFNGVRNTATGAFALFTNSGGPIDSNQPNGDPGSFNTANGDQALFSNTTGSSNTAIGASALLNNQDASGNTAVGTAAQINNASGLFNTSVGLSSLANNISGNGNIALGVFSGGNITTVNDVIAIGAAGQNVANSCFIGQIYTNIQPQVGTDPDLVTINSNGRLGRANVSSRRYKHDIKPMKHASEAIYALNPVTFQYHEQYDPTQTVAFGLIAEEVAEVLPDLVGRNPDGEPESVRYEQINAMVLNEFLKEHRKGEEQDCKIEEQEKTIADLKSEIRNLTATVNQQASELQKVSAWIEMTKAEPQLAQNPH
jgi:trimeric autotransporter adhesin